MSEMYPDSLRRIIGPEKGFGLIAAVFVVVVLAVFGLLIARYTTTSQVESVEDYLWAQALYSAETVMRLNILSHDNGGGGTVFTSPSVMNFTTVIEEDTFNFPNIPSIIRVKAHHPTGVSRTVEAKYLLAN